MFLRKEIAFEEVDEFHDAAIRGVLGLVQLISCFMFQKKNATFRKYNEKESKENFIKLTIIKQLYMSKMMCLLHPNMIILKSHAVLMEKITKSNFHVILSEHLNDAVTVDQFAQIFSAVLTEHIDDVLSD